MGLRQTSLVSLFLLAGVGGCVGSDDLAIEQSAIIGGTLVNAPGVYPSVLALSDGSHLCTATLVHKEWVLTAAHCVDPGLNGYASVAELTPKFKVITDDVNVVDQALTGKVYGLQAVHLHPQWNVNALGDNDIALLHLATPITDRTPSPIHRPVVASGTAVTQVGFGVSNPATQQTDGGGAGVLRQLNTATKGCAEYQLSDTNLLCFDANDGNGTCFGDSGGPTFVSVGGVLEVAGVTSFGTSDDCTGLDASTHVAGELAFIDQYVPGPNNTGGGNNNNGTPGGNTGGTDPDGNPAGGDDGVGEAPSVLGGCSVGQGAGAGGGLAPLVLLGLALLVGRRRA